MKNAITELKKFRDERDWDQFHNPKDLAIAISIESGELLEEFLWKSHHDANIGNIKKELADVLAYSLLLADKYNLDPETISKSATNNKQFNDERIAILNKYTDKDRICCRMRLSNFSDLVRIIG